MRRFFLLLLLIMTSAAAESQLLTYKQILDKPERLQLRPQHVIPYGTDALQYGELWLPTTASNQRLPVVVLIHGGCWRADLPGTELVAFLADDLRKHGVAVWSLTYRRIGHKGGGYPGTFDDVAKGVAHLRELQDKFNLDLTRAVVTGHSAGGHLALWVAALAKVPAQSPLARKPSVNFKAVVGIAAIPDLAHFAGAGTKPCGENTVAELLDLAARGAAGAPFRDTSPSEMLPLGVKQILIHGVRDGIVPPDIGLRYQAQAKASGENVEVNTQDNAGHFELIAPWTVAGRVVVNTILDALK